MDEIHALTPCTQQPPGRPLNRLRALGCPVALPARTGSQTVRHHLTGAGPLPDRARRPRLGAHRPGRLFAAAADAPPHPDRSPGGRRARPAFSPHRRDPPAPGAPRARTPAPTARPPARASYASPPRSHPPSRAAAVRWRCARPWPTTGTPAST
ncbi:hypothetical protein ACR6C2_00905 [Streptomyces sp. INA 01156]